MNTEEWQKRNLIDSADDLRLELNRSGRRIKELLNSIKHYDRLIYERDDTDMNMNQLRYSRDYVYDMLKDEYNNSRTLDSDFYQEYELELNL